jgi:hypothetical protein
MRAAYGRGVTYHWSVTPNGRVFLVSIDWIPGQKSVRALVKPSPFASDRLAAACDGRAFAPAYLAAFPVSARTGLSRAPQPRAPHTSASGPALYRDAQGVLPLPET